MADLPCISDSTRECTCDAGLDRIAFDTLGVDCWLRELPDWSGLCPTIESTTEDKHSAVAVRDGACAHCRLLAPRCGGFGAQHLDCLPAGSSNTMSFGELI